MPPNPYQVAGAVGACRSAVAVHAESRRWLSHVAARRGFSGSVQRQCIPHGAATQRPHFSTLAGRSMRDTLLHVRRLGHMNTIKPHSTKPLYERMLADSPRDARLFAWSVRIIPFTG